MDDVSWLQEKKVLLVDDDEMIRDSMRLFFDAEGWQYRSVEDAEKAFEELATGCYDLIVFDYRLPRMDGMEFLERIQESHPTMAKILITAYGSPGLFSRAERMGAAGCIEKPLTAEKVARCLAQVGKTRVTPK